MKSEETLFAERITALRSAFDQAFAAAPSGASVRTTAFLAMTAGGDPYALRLAEISGLFVDKKVVPLPSKSPDLLGLASFRGALVPVFDLRILLGYPAGTSPRWLVLVAPKSPVGLAFDHLDGYLDLTHEAIAQREKGTEHRRPFLAETLSAAGVVRPVISVASIIETIKQRTSQA